MIHLKARNTLKKGRIIWKINRGFLNVRLILGCSTKASCLKSNMPSLHRWYLLLMTNVSKWNLGMKLPGWNYLQEHVNLTERWVHKWKVSQRIKERWHTIYARNTIFICAFTWCNIQPSTVYTYCNCLPSSRCGQ